MPNFPEADLEYFFTDKDGQKHRWSVPGNSMRPESRQRILDWAKENRVAPPIQQIMQPSKYPVAQAMSDIISTQASFLSGKILLVGDALATQVS